MKMFAKKSLLSTVRIQAAIAAAWIFFFPVAAFAQATFLADLDSNLAGASTPIAISTATTTQLIAAPAGTGPGGATQQIFVTHYEVEAGGAGNIQFVYGTGTNCGTGQNPVTGTYALTAQARAEGGAGFGPVWVIPPGNALCAITSAAVGMNGSLSYRIK